MELNFLSSSGYQNHSDQLLKKGLRGHQQWTQQAVFGNHSSGPSMLKWARRGQISAFYKVKLSSHSQRKTWAVRAVRQAPTCAPLGAMRRDGCPENHILHGSRCGSGLTSGGRRDWLLKEGLQPECLSGWCYLMSLRGLGPLSLPSQAMSSLKTFSVASIRVKTFTAFVIFLNTFVF